MAEPTHLRGFDIEVHNTRFLAYSVNIDRGFTPAHPVVDARWDEQRGAGPLFPTNAERVNGVVRASYPHVGLDALSSRVPGNHAFDQREAIAGTQSAIWHLTNGGNLNASNPLHNNEDGQAEADVLALYRFLIEDVAAVPENPEPGIVITPSASTGEPGDSLPFTVAFTGVSSTTLSVSPEGQVRLTESNGDPLPGDPSGKHPVTPVDSGNKFSAVVSGSAVPGSVRVAAEGDHDLLGELLIREGSAPTPEALVIARSPRFGLRANAFITVKPQATSTTTPSSTLTPSPTPEPTVTSVSPPGSDPVASAPPPADDLAETGASVLAPVLVGLSLLGTGAAALLVVRRRRATS
ncbi:Cys-Gln thioester bond-forming surface protein [Actinokineospora sp. 24-640]